MSSLSPLSLSLVRVLGSMKLSSLDLLGECSSSEHWVNSGLLSGPRIWDGFGRVEKKGPPHEERGITVIVLICKIIEPKTAGYQC